MAILSVLTVFSLSFRVKLNYGRGWSFGDIGSEGLCQQGALAIGRCPSHTSATFLARSTHQLVVILGNQTWLL